MATAEGHCCLITCQRLFDVISQWLTISEHRRACQGNSIRITYVLSTSHLRIRDRRFVDQHCVCTDRQVHEPSA